MDADWLQVFLMPWIFDVHSQNDDLRRAECVSLRQLIDFQRSPMKKSLHLYSHSGVDTAQGLRLNFVT